MSEPLRTVADREAWDAKLEAEERERFPRDIPDVQRGLELLSQAEFLVALDEIMARRPHNKTDLRWQIALWRRDRTAWGVARDKRADAKEAADDA